MHIAGVDEAGRGPLAGPVVAAAVILDPMRPLQGLCDSKKLSKKQREALYALIKESALDYAVGFASPEEIDSINILQASLLAMKRAVLGLTVVVGKVLVDGIHCPELPFPTTAIIRGDASVQSISAASILAKVTRDQQMLAFDASYPGYGFAQHKGYPTRAHKEALHRLGATPIHRRSFSPVKAVL